LSEQRGNVGEFVRRLTKSQESVGENGLLVASHLGHCQCLVVSCVHIYYTVKMLDMTWVTMTWVGVL